MEIVLKSGLDFVDLGKCAGFFVLFCCCFFRFVFIFENFAYTPNYITTYLHV